MKNYIQPLLFKSALFFFLLALSSCSITNIYDARTMEKGQKSLSFQLDSQLQNELFGSGLNPAEKLISLTPFAPGVEYAWGSRKNVDMSLGLSISNGISYGSKGLSILIWQVKTLEKQYLSTSLKNEDMRILIIGGNGTIGKRVSTHFKTAHDVLIGGRNSGDVQIDIADSASIQSAFEKLGKFDAIVNIAGEAKWAPFDELSEEDYYIGLRSKLMGQVNVVRIGRQFLNPKGSITLSTGILADDPVVKTTSAAMVNGAIHSFVKAVNLEMDDIRVNVVSLGVVEDAYEKYRSYFPGHNPVSMTKTVNAYVRSVEGKGRGEIIRIYE
jgi:NAD(P)-dependent dehydrogenase (short-subunit alcohol dehydrogenase family)